MQTNELREEFKRIVAGIRQRTGLKNAQIAKELDYTREYFQALMGSGKITQEHIKNILLRFPEKKENLTEDPAPVYKKSPSEMDRLDQLINNNSKLAESVYLMVKLLSSGKEGQSGPLPPGQSVPVQAVGSQFGNAKRKKDNNQEETDS